MRLLLLLLVLPLRDGEFSTMAVGRTSSN